MRRASALLAITALLAAPLAVFAAEPFAAELTADAEVPPPVVPDDYTGSGSASVTINDDGQSIAYEVSFEGLTGDPVGAHIHFGAAGESGPVILPLDHSSNPMAGTLDKDDFVAVEEGDGPTTFAEALDAIRAGNTYVNIHTEANPPGEIRGQLRALPDTATADTAAPAAGSTAALLVLLAGLAGFVLGARRFALRRA